MALLFLIKNSSSFSFVNMIFIILEWLILIHKIFIIQYSKNEVYHSTNSKTVKHPHKIMRLDICALSFMLIACKLFYEDV